MRSIKMIYEHKTASYVDKIGLVPLLEILEDQDTLTAVDQTLDICNRALEPQKLAVFHGSHFDACVRDQVVTANAARDWYLEHLALGAR